MDKQNQVLPNHKEISKLANELYRKQDEFDLNQPYKVCYVIINILGYRKESEVVKEILQKVLKFTLDYEVGMRYLIKNLAKEYGVELK